MVDEVDQAEVLDWVAQRWPDFASPVWRAMKFGEEAGEVLGAIIKHAVGQKTTDDIKTEAAQAQLCLMALAEANNFDLDQAVADQWRKDRTRTWQARPDWDAYFLGIAEAVARRADCSRRQIGAVIVKDNRIVSTGYNGAPAGMPGCLTDGACPRAKIVERTNQDVSYDEGPGACIAIHAEANALLYASRDKCVGATLYVTSDLGPCPGCVKLIAGAGIVRVVHS